MNSGAFTRLQVWGQSFLLNWQIHQRKFPRYPRIDAAFLRQAGFSDKAFRAIRQSEKNGLYGPDAIQALLSARPRNEVFEINVVENLKAKDCPPMRRPAPQAPGQQDSELQLVGCAAISTAILVPKFPREALGPLYRDWTIREAILWAHELCHLLGLPNLPELNGRMQRVLPKLAGSSRYLMMPPYHQNGRQLLLEETEAIRAYPDNQMELGALRQYIVKMIQRAQTP